MTGTDDDGTPGPWFIEAHGIMNATRSRTICMFGDSDQDDADSRLVAAAPDLLALLREARECEQLQEADWPLCIRIDELVTNIDGDVRPDRGDRGHAG